MPNERTFGRFLFIVNMLVLGMCLVWGSPAQAYDVKVRHQMEAAQKALDQGFGNKAERLWRPLAERGYPEAQFGLAESIGKVWDRERFPEMLDLYRMAAEQGFAPAQNTLGKYYSDGNNAIGIESNLATAISWYRKAATQNYAPAQTALGNLFREGQGTEKDIPEALRWYRKAAEQNYRPAEWALSEIYLTGEGMEKDISAALSLYRKMAARGETDAMDALGALYAEGADVRRNSARSIYWYRKAAGLNSSRAQRELGRRYVTGDGVPRNLAKGIHWLRKALAQGDWEMSDDLKEIFEKHPNIWPHSLFPKALSMLMYDGRPVVLRINGRKTRFTPVRFHVGPQGVSTIGIYCGLIIKEPRRRRQGVTTYGEYHNVSEFDSCDRLIAIGRMPASQGARRIGLSYDNFNNNEGPQRRNIVLIRDKATGQWRIDEEASDEVDLNSKVEIDTLDDMRRVLSRPPSAPAPAVPAE